MRALPGIASISLISLGFALACASSAPVPPQPPAGTHRPFSSERAWQHLTALTDIGPRVAGTEGAERARQYLHDELSKLDIKVEEHVSQIPLPPDYQVTVDATNLIAVIPGASPDLVVLSAPYDSRAVEGAENVGADDGASGAAVLLEIARALADAPLPYTTWVAFFDAEAPRDTTDPRQPIVSLLGSTTFALNLAQLGVVQHIRLMVVMNRVCGPELRVARDLHSHRLYREEFFKSAARTGNTKVFPQSQAFESTNASHRSFLPYGLRRIVAVTGSTAEEQPAEGEGEGDAPVEGGGAAETEGAEGTETPLLVAGFPEDNLEGCSQDSLQAVGVVTLDAVGAIGARLAKVDRFSESPLGERGEPVPVPEGAAKQQDDASEEEAPEGMTPEGMALEEMVFEEGATDEAAAAETASPEEGASETGPGEAMAEGASSEEPAQVAEPEETTAMPEASAPEGTVDDPWTESPEPTVATTSGESVPEPAVEPSVDPIAPPEGEAAPTQEPEITQEPATPTQETVPEPQPLPDEEADDSEIGECGGRPCLWQRFPK